MHRNLEMKFGVLSKTRTLDAIDVAILEALQADAGLTNQAVGELVGLTPGPTHSRIKRLKEEGVIRGMHADLNWRGLGFEFFTTVDVKVSAEKSKEAEDWLSQVPNVWNLCRLKTAEKAREVTFRFWGVSDSRETFLTICHSLLEAFDGFVDIQIQEVELLEREAQVVNVGRVALGDAVEVWKPSSGRTSRRKGGVKS
jgi:DNA-binding Lrp family transcriptional regulator